MVKNAPFSFDKERPLELCAGESLRANTALHHYMAMGPGRSLRKLFDKYRGRNGGKTSAEIGLRNPSDTPGPSPTPPSTRLTTLQEWSSRFQWQARIECWEALQYAEEERIWAERQKEQSEAEWEIRSRISSLVSNMLDEAPKFVKTRRRFVKETNQEIVTVALDGKFLIEAAELVSKLGRLATGMETEKKRHEHSGPGGGPIQHERVDDFAELNGDDLDTFIANLLQAAERDAGESAD